MEYKGLEPLFNTWSQLPLTYLTDKKITAYTSPTRRRPIYMRSCFHGCQGWKKKLPAALFHNCTVLEHRSCARSFWITGIPEIYTLTNGMDEELVPESQHVIPFESYNQVLPGTQHNPKQPISQIKLRCDWKSDSWF